MGKMTAAQIAEVVYGVDISTFRGTEQAPEWTQLEDEQRLEAVRGIEKILSGEAYAPRDDSDVQRAAMITTLIALLSKVEIEAETKTVLVNTPQSGMVGVQYVGKRSMHVDNLYGTGLLWEPGDVHNVDKSTASKMGDHRDVYLIVDAVPGIVNQGKEKASQTKDTEPFVLPNLEGMDVEQLVNFCQQHFGQKLPKTMKPDTMRHRILSLIQAGKMAD